VTNKGASWGDGSAEVITNKYKRHAEMLLEYIEMDKNPRWVFYLAQSYKDAGMYEEAVKWYRRRLIMEGYWEEKYISQLTIGNLMSTPEEKLVELGKCCIYDRSRAEHFVPMIQIYQSQQNWSMAYAIGKFAMENCRETRSRLFVDRSVYETGLLDVHTLSVYHLPRSGRQGELSELVRELEEKVDLFPDKERVQRNIEYFRGVLEE
jgi:tetratricopeptide (TPR) repeat protein